MISKKEYDAIPNAASKKIAYHKNLLKNCVPLEIDRQELKAEMALHRLLSVNNNIEVMDYGQAVYDDPATNRRDRITIVERPDYVKPKEEV